MMIGSNHSSSDLSARLRQDSLCIVAVYALEGKTIKITGTIELYKGKPEIKIMSKDQLILE